ncbi:MAG: hypothetical protein QOJ29_4375, partial [Thermoleophilaceae bacterium]|nr:hypothetical protein [Thermoleophilaceae bacterium]
LALSDVEPSPSARQSLADTPERLGAGFAVAVLSPKSNRIKFLYACHPRLYRRQYGGERSLSAREREGIVGEFGAFLEQATAQRPSVVSPPGFQLVVPGRMELAADDATSARRYLRARTATCPWEAIAYGWAVKRPTVTDPLHKILEEAHPGVRCEWLVGAGGEGKSTVLRSVAWRCAERNEWQVLWGEADGGHCVFPRPWLESRAAGSRVLVCVDGTRQLTGLRDALDAHERFAAGNVTVAVLLADRGTQQRRNRGRLALGRWQPSPRPLAPLVRDEQTALAGALSARGLLAGKTTETAVERLEVAAQAAERDQRRRGRSRERPWLVPTILQLTDLADRPFEQIFESVLLDLFDDDDLASLRLLLAIALVHAAGEALPETIAERLVAERGDLASILDLLRTELEPEDLEAPRLVADSLGQRFLTHGHTVSEGMVKAALRTSGLSLQMSEVCASLPEAMRPDYSAVTLLPKPLFEILDSATRYLDRYLGAYPVAVRLLERWADVDPQAWLARHRLADCYLHALSKELRTRNPDKDRVEELASRSEKEFRNALDIARRVLRPPDTPDKYRTYSLEEEERIVHHGRSVLELALGEPRPKRPGDNARLLRACYLALLSLDVENPERVEHAMGVWIQALFHLGDLESAAQCTAILGDDDYIARKVEPKLLTEGTAVPMDDGRMMDRVIATVARRLWDEHDSISIAPTAAAHRESIRSALLAAAHSEGPSDAMEAVLADLESATPTAMG